MSRITPLIRPNIAALAPYSTARDEYDGPIGIFLDANESPYENGYNRYPDPHQAVLKAKINESKVYSNIWKDPVTLADYPAKKGSIQAKKDYYTAEIEKLINSQADYNRIKKQLARLQNISQEYVKEMDQLYQENKALKEENQQVKATLEQEREVTRSIQKSNEDLSQKISNAATYKAYNIKSGGYMLRNKGTEEPTDKASKVKRIKTTLMLGENSLIEPGPVNVYCRIAIPETGKVLTMGSGDTYSFVHNGQRLQYSCKTVVNYDNKAENVTLNWDLMSDDKAIKGQYSVQLYTDDQFLGETLFTLR